MILALFVKRKKRNILLCIYRENGKDGAFYLSIILHGKSNGAVLVCVSAASAACGTVGTAAG
jgi:hypothetical protein